jgi:hypothetical protein
VTRVAALALVVALAGCESAGTIVRDRPVEVKVPVFTPCVAGPRPAKVRPLKEELAPAEWQRLDVRQKAAAAGRKGLERQTYGEQLNAATGACPETTEGELR